MSRRTSKMKKPNTNSREVKDQSSETKEKVVDEKKVSDSEVNPKGIPSAANDPEWYSRDPQLLMDAANIPFSTPFGAKLDMFPAGTLAPVDTGVVNHANPKSIPGICSVILKPSISGGITKLDPANVCANAMYTHVRYINSGRKNYDPADLMMYAMTFGDIYSYLCWSIRLYNYAYMYSQRNWYIGRDLIIANGVDPDNIVQNLANYRAWINSVINKISSFCVPGDIYYFRRRVFLYSNYYIENPYNNEKDQMYQFVPDGFYRFDYDAHGAGKLAYTPMDRSGGLWTTGDIAVYFNRLMDNITGDEDFGLMSGDVLKAYGENIIHMSQIGPEAILLPVHDPYVLSQFKNAKVISALYRGDSTKTYNDLNGDAHIYGDIEQSTDGLIVSREYLDTSTYKYQTALLVANYPISVENPVPGPGDVVEATRLTPALTLTTPDGVAHYWELTCGTEIPVDIRITYQPSPDNNHVFIHSDNQVTTNTDGKISMNLVRMLSAFKYSPTMFSGTYSENDGLTDLSILSNMDNTTQLTPDILGRLHSVCLLSLFYVPGVAKLI